MSLEELGRRVVMCAGFRWLPGMRTMSGIRVSWCDAIGTNGGIQDGDCRVRPKQRVITSIEVDWQHEQDGGSGLPDLSDPATNGCMLALVREAWGSDARVTLYSDGAVRVSMATTQHIFGDLVSSLEAAYAFE